MTHFVGEEEDVRFKKSEAGPHLRLRSSRLSCIGGRLIAVIPAAPPFSPSVLQLIQLQNDGMDLTTPAASTTCGIIFISLHRATEEKGRCNSKAYVRLAAFYYITNNDVSLMPRRARARDKTHTLPTLDVRRLCQVDTRTEENDYNAL